MRIRLGAWTSMEEKPVSQEHAYLGLKRFIRLQGRMIPLETLVSLVVRVPSPAMDRHVPCACLVLRQ